MFFTIFSSFFMKQGHRDVKLNYLLDNGEVDSERADMLEEYVYRYFSFSMSNDMVFPDDGYTNANRTTGIIPQETQNDDYIHSSYFIDIPSQTFDSHRYTQEEINEIHQAQFSKLEKEVSDLDKTDPVMKLSLPFIKDGHFEFQDIDTIDTLKGNTNNDTDEARRLNTILDVLEWKFKMDLGSSHSRFCRWFYNVRMRGHIAIVTKRYKHVPRVIQKRMIDYLADDDLPIAQQLFRKATLGHNVYLMQLLLKRWSRKELEFVSSRFLLHDVLSVYGANKINVVRLLLHGMPVEWIKTCNSSGLNLVHSLAKPFDEECEVAPLLFPFFSRMDRIQKNTNNETPLHVCLRRSDCEEVAKLMIKDMPASYLTLVSTSAFTNPIHEACASKCLLREILNNDKIFGGDENGYDVLVAQAINGDSPLNYLTLYHNEPDDVFIRFVESNKTLFDLGCSNMTMASSFGSLFHKKMHFEIAFRMWLMENRLDECPFVLVEDVIWSTSNWTHIDRNNLSKWIGDDVICLYQ
eukprot:TRINITY_DN4066_c0_g2_i3.p1 TRINITY_DN4066_c0_g2~~TRINITY_DN4066_c0_g2_i3.p1  ORF type:complete len:521 (+),score=84.11 TRINITY_DN4066_c0_g2_i3:65-1627(+)